MQSSQNLFADVCFCDLVVFPDIISDIAANASPVPIRKDHASQFQEHHTFDTCHLSTIQSHNSFLCYCTICTHDLVKTACFLVHTDVYVFSMEFLTGSNRASSLRSSALCSIAKFLQGLFITYLDRSFLTASGLIIPQSISTPSSTKIPHWLHISPTSLNP